MIHLTEIDVSYKALKQYICLRQSVIRNRHMSRPTFTSPANTATTPPLYTGRPETKRKPYILHFTPFALTLRCKSK